MATADGAANGNGGEVAGRGVQSIEVGGRLLQALVQAGQPMMLRDIASGADVTPAQAHAYLVSFRKLGLVEQDAATGRYQLGPFALQLGLARMRAFNPLRFAGEAAARLSAELGLMVTVTVWGSFGPTIVQVHEAADQVHVNLRAGAVYSLTGTATGRVFGAFLPATALAPRLEEELAEGSRRQRIGALATRERFDLEVTLVRGQGYAVAEGSPIPGINGLAAPVFDHTGQLQLVITLIGPTGVVRTGAGSAEVAALLDFTQRLSSQLGHRPEPVVAPAPRRARRGAEAV
jgi:DNA-binding IclR family transcriptional regulator